VGPQAACGCVGAQVAAAEAGRQGEAAFHGAGVASPRVDRGTAPGFAAGPFGPGCNR